MSENRVKNKGKFSAKSHPFTGKITCSTCGGKYTRKTTNGKAAWICGTYMRFGKDACPSKRIPEEILLEISSSVTKGGELEKVIKEIKADGQGGLSFHLISGKVETMEWENKSRKDCWTDEMKEKARRRTMKCNNQKKSL